MRPSHHLCLLVPSIHRSSTAIFDRPFHDSSSVSSFCKRSRSPAAFVPLSLPTLGELSYADVDLLPSPKRIRSPETAMDLEGYSEDSFEPYVPREAGLGVDFEVESSEPSRSRGTDLEMDVEVVRSDGIDIDPKIQAEIDEYIAYADAFRDRGIDARVVGHRIVATGQQSADMLEMIRELERDNKRLRDMMDVTSQRVARTMPNTRSGASRTRKGLNEQINHQMAGALGARTTAMNLEPLMRDGGGQEEVNGNGENGNGGNRNKGNGNGGNGNDNGNGGGNGYNFKGFVPARECTYQDFLKCQPLTFNGTEGVVGLTHWFEKMETVFHISNCPERTYEVDDISVLSKKQGPEDGDRVVEFGCEGK
ncbi:hypothetical protein Tco_1013582 [Tanacetum coccineum]